jgi:hypothetical protein
MFYVASNPFFIPVFWITKPCSLIGGYQCFGGAYRRHIQYITVGNHLQDYMAS